MTDAKNGPQKDTAFEAARVTAWFKTKLERDKSLLALSAGGIALLLTPLASAASASIISLVVYILAVLSFFVCAGAVLWIFQQNAVHLEEIRSKGAKQDATLAALDIIAVASFALGVLFSSVLGVSAAIDSFVSKEIRMPQHDKTGDLPNVFQKSFNGAAKLIPDASQSGEAQGTGQQQGSSGQGNEGAATSTQTQNQDQGK